MTLLRIAAICLVSGALLGVDLPTLSVPRAARPPAMTAVADDPAWDSAATVPALMPCIGSPPGFVPPATEVRLLWDAEWLYLRSICRDDDIHLSEHGRDAPLYRGDCLELFLDPVGDSRAVHEFQLSPANDIFDSVALLTAEVSSGENGMLSKNLLARERWEVPAWNCEGLRTAANRLSDGWLIEVALPAKAMLKRLGRQRFVPMELRANLVRVDWKRIEGGERQFTASAWAPVTLGCPHISPQRCGTLQLVE